MGWFSSFSGIFSSASTDKNARKSLRQQHGFKDFDEYKRSIEQFDLEDGMADTKSPGPRSQRNLKNSSNGGER